MEGTGGSEAVVEVKYPETSAELGRNLLRALSNAGISVLYQDPQLRVVWARNVPPSWSGDDILGATDHQFLPVAEAGRVIDAKKAVLKSGQPQRLEIHVPGKDGVKWFNIWIDADRSDTNMGGIVTTAVDITEQKRREQTLMTLLREVSHRSRNLLAIIQSIATQTGRYSSTIDGFLARLRGRLQSLASSQDLVTSSDWSGVDLHELVSSQMAQYAAVPDQRIHMEGISPFLNPNAALHIGLALHELAANSASYGALSLPRGKIDVFAHIVRDGSTPAANVLELIWRENLPPGEDNCVENKRFGSVALEKVVPASLNGSATLAVQPGQLEYRLLVPQGSYEIA